MVMCGVGISDRLDLSKKSSAGAWTTKMRVTAFSRGSVVFGRVLLNAACHQSACAGPRRGEKAPFV